MPPATGSPSSSEKLNCKAMKLTKLHYFFLSIFVLAAIAIFNETSLSIQPAGTTVARDRDSSGRLSWAQTKLATSSHDATVIYEAAQQAKEILIERYDAYQVAKRDASEWTMTMRGKPFEDTNFKDTWRLRGMGYVYTRHEVIFAAVVPPEPIQPGRNVIQIFNTLPTPINCSKWTIWVRVAGPEIFAGSAQAVQSKTVPQSILSLGAAFSFADSWRIRSRCQTAGLQWQGSSARRGSAQPL